MTDYAGAYHQLLRSTAQTMKLIMRSSAGNDMARIYTAIKRGVSDSEDIILEHDIISGDMYHRAYNHLADQIKSTIEFAGQHNTDIYNSGGRAGHAELFPCY